MRRNFILLLKENNADEKEEFNCQDFINMFKKILPNSPDSEVRKLFNILHGDHDNDKETEGILDNDGNINNKTISFNGMLNDPSNFNKLLSSMGCINEHEHDLQSQQGGSGIIVDLEHEHELSPRSNYNELTESEPSQTRSHINNDHDHNLNLNIIQHEHEDEPEETEIYDDEHEVDIIHEIETTPIGDMMDLVNGINGSSQNTSSNNPPIVPLPFSNIDSHCTIHDNLSDTEVNT